MCVLVRRLFSHSLHIVRIFSFISFFVRTVSARARMCVRSRVCVCVRVRSYARRSIGGNSQTFVH